LDLDRGLKICQNLQPSFIEINLFGLDDLLNGEIGDYEMLVSQQQLHFTDCHALVFDIAQDLHVGRLRVRDVSWLIFDIVFHHEIMQSLETVEV